MKPSNQYYYGFDWLRAVMSLTVVASHVYLTGATTLLFNPAAFNQASILARDIVFFHFFCLPVPVFFLISSFLYQKNNRAANCRYLAQKLRYLGSLLFFWTLAYCLFTGNHASITRIGEFGWQKIGALFLNANNTIYYFFSSLMITTVISYLSMPLSKRSTLILAISSTILLYIMVVYVYMTNTNQAVIALWSSINFICYPFHAALIIKHGEQSLKTKTIIIISIGYIIVGLSEWAWIPNKNPFFHNYCAIPIYTRISIPLGAIILFLISLKIKTPPPRLITISSDYSLGLYCLHPFVLLPLAKQIHNRTFLFLATIAGAYLLMYLKNLIDKRTVLVPRSS